MLLTSILWSSNGCGVLLDGGVMCVPHPWCRLRVDCVDVVCCLDLLGAANHDISGWCRVSDVTWYWLALWADSCQCTYHNNGRYSSSGRSFIFTPVIMSWLDIHVQVCEISSRGSIT